MKWIFLVYFTSTFKEEKERERERERERESERERERDFSNIHI